MHQIVKLALQVNPVKGKNGGVDCMFMFLCIIIDFFQFYHLCIINIWFISIGNSMIIFHYLEDSNSLSHSHSLRTQLYLLNEFYLIYLSATLSHISVLPPYSLKIRGGSQTRTSSIITK